MGGMVIKMMQIIESAKALRQYRAELNNWLTKAKDEKTGKYDLTSLDLEELGRRENELAEMVQRHDLLRLEWLNAKEMESLERESRSFESLPALPMEPESKSLGELFVQSPAFSAFNPGNKGNVSETVHLDLSLKTLMSTSAGFAPQPIRTGRVADMALSNRLSVLDVVNIVTTDQSAVVYMEETTYSDNAAERAEGATAAEATLVYTQRTSDVRSIAVYLPVTDEQLEDVSGLEARINNRLALMVQRRLASQILNGNGTSPNLRGILNTTGIQTLARGGDPPYDAVFNALNRVSNLYEDQEASAIFIHPNDWKDVVLTTTTDGFYIFGPPNQAVPLNLYGVPIIVTAAIAENTVLVGDMMYHYVAERRGLDIQVGFVNDDFAKYQRSIRASVRVANVVERPVAFCTVTSF